MRFSVLVDGKRLLALAVFGIIFCGLAVVVAQPGLVLNFAAPPAVEIPNPGHSSAEVIVNVDGPPTGEACAGNISLQSAIDNGCIDGAGASLPDTATCENNQILRYDSTPPGHWICDNEGAITITGNEFTDLKISHLIMPLGSTCPVGYISFVIGNNSGDDQYGVDKRRYWDCRTGIVYYDGCAASVAEEDMTNKQKNYNVLCLSAGANANKLHYIVTSMNDSLPYSTCPVGWVKYDAPIVRHTNGQDYWAYWDCSNGVTKQAGCTAIRTTTLASNNPSTAVVRYGRMCFSDGDNSVSYFVVARNAVCPADWLKVLASSDYYWDCSGSLSIQGGCAQRDGSTDEDNKYGALCIRS